MSILILIVVLIAGCSQTTVSKPRYYCYDNNFTVCNDLIDNCTDSIIVQENAKGDTMSVNITNEKDNCSLMFSFIKLNVLELTGTSMTCNIPLINGKLSNIDLSKSMSTFCKGSYVDKFYAPSGFIGSTARGFSTLAVLQPWSLKTDGTFQVTLENRIGKSITVNKIYLMNTDGSTASTGTLSSTAFEETEKQFLTISLSGNAIPSTAKIGDTYTYALVIEYKYSGVSFNSTGTISGTYS